MDTDKSPLQHYLDAHRHADTDNESDSIHHTLGYSPNQAAPGNHSHSDLVVEPVLEPFGYIFNSAAQSIPNTSVTVVTFNSTEESNVVGFDDTANNRLVAPQDGLYYIEGQVGYVANGTGARLTRFLVNGTIWRTTRQIAPGALQVFPSVNTLLRLLAGDAITLETQQTSGAALSTIAGRPNTYLMAKWLAV